MIQSALARKLYIVPLRFGTSLKNLYLDGDASADGEQRLQEAIGGLNVIGDQCDDWVVFLQRAVRHFQSFGLVQVSK
jgi:hypothetical protein